MLCSHESLAFNIPERLEYDLSWSGIKAGSAVQEIAISEESVSITSTARSADWISVFHKVEDKIVSVVGKGAGQLMGTPRSFSETIKEGNYRRRTDITFDHPNKKAQVENLLDKKHSTFDITPITYDSLSSFFYLRLQKLEPGTSIFVDVFDGKKLHGTEVKVLRREELSTDVGKFKTILVMPILKTAGLFSKTGDLYIWLSDDDLHIPLKMKSKIKIGSITATITGGSHWPKK
jgi:hypothetical protein